LGKGRGWLRGMGGDEGKKGEAIAENWDCRECREG